MRCSYIMGNKLLHYKKSSNIELLKLIEGDITFSVLYRILQNNCSDIFTNYERLIFNKSQVNQEKK